MKYLTILKVIWHYVLAGLGKLTGYIVTPLVYPHREWYMMRVLGKVVVKVYPYLVVTLPHVILAYTLRRYANNVVFNYVLQNGRFSVAMKFK